MATKKISDFTASSSPELHWLIPFAEEDTGNYKVRFDDYQRYFGQGSGILSIGNSNPDSSTIFNLYSTGRGFAASAKYFSLTGIGSGNIYAGGELRVSAPNLYVSGQAFYTYSDTFTAQSNTFVGSFSSVCNLTASTFNIDSPANGAINFTSKNFNVTASGETHILNSGLSLKKTIGATNREFFNASYTGVAVTPTTNFTARLTGVGSRIDLASSGIYLASPITYITAGSNSVVVNEDEGIEFNVLSLFGTVGNLNFIGDDSTTSFVSRTDNVTRLSQHSADAFRYVARTGWQSNIPFYFQADNNGYSDAFYFYSESGKFRTATNNLGLKAFSNVEISGGNLYIQGGYFNVTNDQSLFDIDGYGSNLKSSITTDSDGLSEIQNDTLNLYQNSLYSYSANSTRIISNNSILLTGVSVTATANNSVSLSTTASFAIPGVQASGPNNITMESDGTNTIVSDTLIMRQNSANYISAGSDTFQANSFLITATGTSLSLADRTGYIIRSTGDTFISSDKAAITFGTNGADSAKYSSETVLWTNKTTGFFSNSGSIDFSTLLRTGDFYLDSLRFAFVGASGAATNFAIDLSIREKNGAVSKIVGNTGVLRMNSSDFTKHTSLDGRDYLETDLDVGIILKGGTYSYDVFTTIATGNSVPWTGRLGINGQFIRKSYADFLTGGP